MNREQYNSDLRYKKVLEQMDLLGIMDITTTRKAKNGTVEWKLPVRCQYGGEIHVASFASGYVRRTKAGGYCPSWQLNKTKKQKRYVEMTDYDTGRPVIRTFKDTVRILIEDEQDRLEYLISFCLKNYYIGQANKLSSGEFIPKWKHEYELKKKINIKCLQKSVKILVNDLKLKSIKP